MGKKDKNNKNLAGNMIKKYLKSLAIKIICIVAIVVLVGALVYQVIKGFQDLLSNIIDAIGSIGQVFVPTTSINSDYTEGINITDDKLQYIIEALEDNGVTLEDLYLSGDTLGLDEDSEEYKKELYKYLRKFLQADVCTQYPDFGIVEDDTHYNGILKIRRAVDFSSIEEAIDMEYVVKDKFEAIEEEINKNTGSSDSTPVTGTFDSKIYDYDVKNISIGYENGNDIKSTIIAPAGAPENLPLVIMCHDFADKKTGKENSFINLGKMLAVNGIAAISIDFPGCGNSDAPGIEYTLSEMKIYLDYAIEYMEEMYKIDSSKIGIVGDGMGARLASLYLENEKNDIQAIILWSPKNEDGLSCLSFLGDYQKLYESAKKNESVNSGVQSRGREFLLSKKFFEEIEKSNPQQALNSFGGLKKTITNSESMEQEELIKQTADELCLKFVGYKAGENDKTEDLYSGHTLGELRELAKKVYTIDNDGNLYFMEWYEHICMGKRVEYSVEVQKVNYHAAVEKYAFPMQVAIALCQVTHNPEYVYQFIDKYVLGGEIVITVLDNTLVDTWNSWYEWQIDVTSKGYNTVTDYDEEGNIIGSHEEFVGSITESVEGMQVEHDPIPYGCDVETTVEATAQITSVNTWMSKVDINFSNSMSRYSEEKQEDVECPVDINYAKEEVTGINADRVEQTCDLVYCYWKRHDDFELNQWSKGTVSVDEVAVEEKAKNIIRQWDEEFRIANTTISEAPGPYLEDNADIFLELLNTESTQRQSEIYKYFLYLYTNVDYGVTILDNSIYGDTELDKVFTEDLIVDITKSNENLILTKEQIQQAIQQCYSGNAESNLLGALDAFYYIQQTNKVNAIFGIAVAVQESSAGTNWALIDQSTHNWMSVTGSYMGQTYEDKNGTNWRSYDSFDIATRDFGNLISTSSNYFKGGNYTVKTIAQKYCVPPDGWANGVLSIMKKLYFSLGIDLGEYMETGEEDIDAENNPANINGKTFLEIAKQCHDYINANNFKYVNGNRIPYPNGTNYTDCSAYISWVIYEFGYTEFAGTQHTSAWFMGNGPKTKGWVVLDASQAKPGDILAKYGHVEIYAGNGTYSAGSEDSINSTMSYVGCSLSRIIELGGFTRAIRVTAPN